MLGQELVLETSEGRRRTHVIVLCKCCGNEFPKPKRFVKKNSDHYCSVDCKNKATKKVVECALCGKILERSPTKALSKSGLIFCCREHKEIAQSHKGKRLIKCGHDADGYRLLALAHYGEKCEWCDESLLSLLDVHHIDHDRSNNELENLIVLCVRCHALETRKLVVLENRKPIPIHMTLMELRLA